MTHPIDPHVVMVCVFAVAFLIGVSGMGDKPRGKKKQAYRRRPVARKPEQWKRAPKPLPRSRR